MPDAPETPSLAYRRRLERQQAQLSNLRRKDRGFVFAKLALIALILGWMIFFLYVRRDAWALPLAAAAYALLALGHETTLKRLGVAGALSKFYTRGLARLDDRWAGDGEPGERFLDDAHPYARDLDLFGKGSAFERLCVFRGPAAAETLAQWLLHPAPPAEILSRQTAAQELLPRLEFREQLSLAGDNAAQRLYADKLIAWGEQRRALPARAMTIMAPVLALLWIASLALALASGLCAPVIVCTLLNIAVTHRFRKKLGEAADETEEATAGLNLFVAVTRVLEKEPFHSEKLLRLQATLQMNEDSAARAIQRLNRTTHFLEQRANPIVRVFDLVLFYSVLLTLRAERWRQRHGSAIRGWLAATGELEALTALSCYAFERPEDCWPEFAAGPATLEAEDLAQPLLPVQRAVRNSLKLDARQMQLLLLSGPNMAGKSTLVRGVGLNSVLAQCGAPVRATRMRLSPLAVGASICVLDSLQGGVSRFYAEIKRLKRIADMAQGSTPVLFLLDELFSGTNSQDRLEGSRMVVGALLRSGAIGMVTTHDLALTALPAEWKEKAANVHFEDRIENGELRFDYQLKPGVVQTRNALKLMQSIGFRCEAE